MPPHTYSATVCGVASVPLRSAIRTSTVDIAHLIRRHPWRTMYLIGRQSQSLDMHMEPSHFTTKELHCL